MEGTITKLLRNKSEVDLLIELRKTVDARYAEALELRKVQLEDAGFDSADTEVKNSYTVRAMADTLSQLVTDMDSRIEACIASMQATGETKH